MAERRHDWGYDSDKEPRLADREIECMRGKIIGGCSSVNAMAYVRGNRGDYDRWATSGLPDWSYDKVLPFFRRQETWEAGANEFRGDAGPVGTRRSGFNDPIVESFFAAVAAAGHPTTEDYNGAQQEGIGTLQLTVRHGRRCSTATAYLRPALHRNNLVVHVNARATRILFDKARAIGIEYQQAGETRSAMAEREVLLTSGVINTPQLLMLSGIGPPDQLRAHELDIRVPLPGVGANLQDHLTVNVEYRRRDFGLLHRHMRLDRTVASLAQACLFRTGIWGELPSGWTGFFKTRPELAMPDVQFLFRALPSNAGPYLSPFRKPYADGFAVRAVMLRPQSRGTVSLTSADPSKPMRIRFNFLTRDAEWETLRAGIRLIRDFARQSPLQRFIAGELAPGPGATSDSDLDAHIRATAITAHHPLGTCKMGAASDPTAVVDPELRVRGISGLRVVDASVMPDLVGGNINAPVIMIAEKAADMIRAHAVH